MEVVALVVIGLIGGSLLLTVVQQTREPARRVKCEDRLLAAGFAIQYATAQRPNEEYLGYVIEQAGSPVGRRQKIGWAFALLPYLDSPGLLQALHDRQAEPSKSEKPKADLEPGPWNALAEKFGPDGERELRGQTPKTYIPSFLCPDDPRLARRPKQPWLSYVANCGQPDADPTPKFPADWPANGIFMERFRDRDPAHAVTPGFVEGGDGLSYTFLLSENADAGLWTDSSEAQCGFLWCVGSATGELRTEDPLLAINQQRGAGDGSPRYARPASFHPHGVNVIYADGRTQFLADNLPYRLYVTFMTPDGQNVRKPGGDQLLEPPYREERRPAKKEP